MKKIILLTTLICIGCSFLAAPTSYAQGANGDNKVPTLKESTFDVGDHLNPNKDNKGQDYFDEGKSNPLVNFFLTVLDFAIRVVGSIAIIIFIIAGFMFMFAQGNQQKIDDAKEVVKYGVIGLLVVFLSYIIVISIRAVFIPEEQGNNTSFNYQETYQIS